MEGRIIYHVKHNIRIFSLLKIHANLESRIQKKTTSNINYYFSRICKITHDYCCNLPIQVKTQHDQVAAIVDEVFLLRGGRFLSTCAA